MTNDCERSEGFFGRNMSVSVLIFSYFVRGFPHHLVDIDSAV
jgi:hypothetical protein